MTGPGNISSGRVSPNPEGSETSEADDWTQTGASLDPYVIAGYLKRRYDFPTFNEDGSLVPIGEKYKIIRREMEKRGETQHFLIYSEWRRGLQAV